jgi:hypothetical protein
MVSVFSAVPSIQ